MVNRGSWIGICVLLLKPYEISLLGGNFHNISVEHVLTFPPKVWSLLYNLDIIRVLCFFTKEVWEIPRNWEARFVCK